MAVERDDLTLFLMRGGVELEAVVNFLIFPTPAPDFRPTVELFLYPLPESSQSDILPECLILPLLNLKLKNARNLIYIT